MSSDDLTVALVQPDLRWQDPEANCEHLAELMHSAEQADLFVLPETFSSGFLGDAGQLAETLDGPTVAWMREQARRRGAAICGSLALDVDGRRVNRFVFVDEQGRLAGHYDKRHLFSFGGEDQRYSAGSRFEVIDWRGWRIDLQVCYDLRFPVWCRNTRKFDLQLFVANWPSPRVEAWRALLRARAIENQAAVIGVNCSSIKGKDMAYPGRSSAWDAMGECLLELGQQESVGLVSLSLASIHRTRREFPFLVDSDRFDIEH